MIGIIADYLGAQNDGETDGETLPGRPSRPSLLTDDELVPCLVDKLREGDVSDEQLIALRTSILGDQTPSMAVKLDHLRSKVADLEAYSDALEEFIDGEGTARYLLEELRDDLRATNAGLDELSTRVESVEDDQSSVRDELSALEADLNDLDDYVHTLEGRHSRELVGVDAKVDRVGQSVDAVRDDVAELDGRVTVIESLEAEVRELRELETTVAAMESELESLRSVPDEVDELAGQVETMASVQDAVSEMQDDVAELETFRTEFVRALSTD